MTIVSIFRATVVGTISLLILPASVLASDELDQREVRALVERGEIQSLAQLRSQYRELLEGRLLDLEVEREKGAIIYELEVLTDQGQVFEYRVDARTGALLERERED